VDFDSSIDEVERDRKFDRKRRRYALCEHSLTTVQWFRLI